MQEKQAETAPGPAALLVIEAEQYPAAVIVELWHAGADGKREFLDSRRYEPQEATGAGAAPAGGGAAPRGARRRSG
jgi:hypothetical protein